MARGGASGDRAFGLKPLGRNRRGRAAGRRPKWDGSVCVRRVRRSGGLSEALGSNRRRAVRRAPERYLDRTATERDRAARKDRAFRPNPSGGGK